MEKTFHISSLDNDFSGLIFLFSLYSSPSNVSSNVQFKIRRLNLPVLLFLIILYGHYTLP